MKLFAHSLMLVAALLATHGYAQTRKVSELPDSIIWNLHPEEREEFFEEDFGLPVSRSDSAIWKKPSPPSVKLIYLAPADLGLDGSDIPGFIAKVKQEKGALPCPEWVPVQLFLRVDYTGEALWIPTPRTASGQGEMARLGRNRLAQSNAFTGNPPRMDLFPGDPRRSKANSVWVFSLP